MACKFWGSGLVTAVAVCESLLMPPLNFLLMSRLQFRDTISNCPGGARAVNWVAEDHMGSGDLRVMADTKKAAKTVPVGLMLPQIY